MTNEIIKAEPPLDTNQFVIEYREKKLTDPQISYLLLYERKKRVENELLLKELEAQKLLIAPGETITEIEATLAQYRKLSDELPEIRKKITKELDEKIYDKLTVYEKRVAYKLNPQYKEHADKLLDLKLAQKQKLDNEARKKLEEQRYVAHIENQNTIIVSEFVKQAKKLVHDYYVECLMANIENPDLFNLRKSIEQLKFGESIIFKRELITNEDDWKIVKRLTPPDKVKIRMDALAAVDTVFSLYKTDLEHTKNTSSTIIEDIKKVVDKELQDIEDNSTTFVLTNALVAESLEVPTIKPEGRQITQADVVVIENNMDWVDNILTAFISNKEIRSYLNSRIKDFSNLSIAQIADAIGKYATQTGYKFEKLKYKQITK